LKGRCNHKDIKKSTYSLQGQAVDLKNNWLRINIFTLSEEKMTAQTIDEAMQNLATQFVPEKAKGIDMVIQFIFTGEQAGDYFITVKDQKVTVEKGKAAKATATLSAAGTDYLKIMTGQLDGTMAFMQGKLRSTGDMNALMKMQQIFKFTK
jgi:putative sterol carrier protein